MSNTYRFLKKQKYNIFMFYFMFYVRISYRKGVNALPITYFILL